jgi:hypothetical protein
MAVNLKTNEIPTTIVVGEIPLAEPIASTFTLTQPWQRWMTTLATWVTKSQSIVSGSLYNGDTVCGSYTTNRSSNVVVVQGKLNAGAYDTISITGIPVPPMVKTLISFKGTTDALGILGTDSTLNVSVTGASDIIFTGTYIAQKEKFVKE